MIDRESKGVAVFTRVTLAQAVVLDQVQFGDPSLSSRPDAIRHLIDTAAITLADTAAGKETPSLAPADLDRIIAAVDARTRAYNDLAKQVRSVGHLANTLAKLGHQAVTYGRHTTIPVQAVEGVSRGVQQALALLTVLAHQDVEEESVIRTCPRP